MSDQSDDCNSSLPEIEYVRNFPFLKGKLFNRKYIEDSMDYLPKDDDVILCSYPKTGTTWLEYIIWQVLHKGESFPEFKDMASKNVPYMEITGTKLVEELKPPRFYRNHFPYYLMKINEKAKYIYIHRNPADTVVSFYHFSKHFNENPCKFDTFFEGFLKGTLVFGDYFDHVLSFYAHKDEAHVLLVSYEDLHRDIRGQILRLAKFLGDEYYTAVIEDETLLNKIIEVTSFDFMKKNLSTAVSFPKGDTVVNKEITMFRKGVIGDSKTLLSEDQLKQLHDRILEKMKGTDLAQLWSKC